MHFKNYPLKSRIILYKLSFNSFSVSQSSFYDAAYNRFPYFNCFIACSYQNSCPFLYWQALFIAIQTVLPWMWWCKSLLLWAVHRWVGWKKSLFGVVALVGKIGTISFTFIPFCERYTKKAHRRLGKCQRNLLNWVCVRCVSLCSISLIALSNIHSNPLLTCSSWKIKNHVSDSMEARTWLSFYSGSVSELNKMQGKPSLRHFCWQESRPGWQLHQRLPNVVGGFLIQQLPGAAVAYFWTRQSSLRLQPGMSALLAAGS